MSTGIVVYGIDQSVESNMTTVKTTGEFLGIGDRPARLRRTDEATRVATDISVHQAAREMDRSYQIDITENDADYFVFRNKGTFVSLAKATTKSGLIAFSKTSELADFLEDPVHRKILALVRGRYGFALDWKSKASFWAFSYGFEDFEFTGDADTPAGLWGASSRLTAM